MHAGRFPLKPCKGRTAMKSLGTAVRALGFRSEAVCPSCYYVSSLPPLRDSLHDPPTSTLPGPSRLRTTGAKSETRGSRNSQPSKGRSRPLPTVHAAGSRSTTRPSAHSPMSTRASPFFAHSNLRLTPSESGAQHCDGLREFRIRVYATSTTCHLHDGGFADFETDLLRTRIQKLERMPHVHSENLAITTFNILAPIYKRMNGNENSRESGERSLWVHRNTEILSMLLEKQSSIICLQEFWLENQELVDLYTSVLNYAGYAVFLLPRTNNRGDGLFTAIKKDQLRVLDHQHLLFNDFGDRVAQILRLQFTSSNTTADSSGIHEKNSLHRIFSCPFSTPSSSFSIPPSRMISESMEMIVVNTHLLFPHDQHYSFVRIRQVYKMLQFLESYQSKNNLENVPVLLCGDWNGSKRGNVYKFLRARGFVSSYDISRRYKDEDSHKWVSHKNHRGDVCGVDFIWLNNFECDTNPLIDDWIKVIILAIKTELNTMGFVDNKDIFRFFQPNHRNDSFSLEEFKDGLCKLNLNAKDSLGLTDEETSHLLEYMNVNHNGAVLLDDFVELFDVHLEQPLQGTKKNIHGWISNGAASFLDMFPSASHPLSSPLGPFFPSFLLSTGNPSCSSTLTIEKRRQSRLEKADPPKLKSFVFEVQDAHLHPPEAESGKWPEDWKLSDHTPLTAVFKPLSP